MLEWRERRHRIDRTRASVVAVAALAGIIVLIGAAMRMQASIAALYGYWPLIFVVAMVHSATTVGRRHRRATEDWSQSWLAAAPLSAASVRLVRVVEMVAGLLVQYLLACGLLLMLAIAADDPQPLAAPWKALTVGVLVGSLRALWTARSGKKQRREASRYAPVVKPVDPATLRPSDSGLSRWPVALAISRGRPENARMLFLAVTLLVIQPGTPALRGLLILAMWTMGGYLVSLVIAGITVARDAAEWLRPTPIGRAGFAWPLLRRAWLHQSIGTAITAVALIASGTPWFLVVRMSLSWLLLALAVPAAATLMSHRS